MAEINETEQWKLSGNCEKCRRANHCQKDCTAAKKRQKRKEAALFNAITDTFLAHTGLRRFY